MKSKLLILFVLASFCCSINGQSDTTENDIDNETKPTTVVPEIAESDLVRNNNSTADNNSCSSCSSFPVDTSLDTKIGENVSKTKIV